jgi:probable addiction module antidote protein
MTETLAPYDPADYLDDAESIAAYLKEYAGRGASSAEIIAALGRIARAKGMAEVAKRAGLGRESLYKSLSAGGNPEWATVVKVLAALDLTIAIVPARKAKCRQPPAQRV